MKPVVIVLLAALLLSGCKKDDEVAFTSAAGVWTYTTPDGKIGVDFELFLTGSTWDVKNPVIRVDGTTYEAVYIGKLITPPTLGTIRINANDLAAVYAYNIQFSNGKVSDDFKEIKVPDATYTWPHDKTNALTTITITRK